MAVVATAERGLIVYQLENQPSEFRRIDSPLKHQVNTTTCNHLSSLPSHLVQHCTTTFVFLDNGCEVKYFVYIFSCSTAVSPYSRTNRTSPQALHWEVLRAEWPSTTSTLQTRECLKTISFLKGAFIPVTQQVFHN